MCVFVFSRAGDIRIIRPLIYVRERLTREYATVADLPIINESQNTAARQQRAGGAAHLRLTQLTS